MKDMLVLLSTYNGETYLREQLDSVLKQTIPVDILVRDDGSCDDTVKILEEYTNIYDNFTYFIGENVGVVRSFIDLLKHADGYRYYAFSDQDDVWFLDKLEIAKKRLDQMDQELPCLYCSCSLLVNNDMEGDQTTQIDRRGINFYNIMIQNLMPGHAQVFNKKLIDLMFKYETDFAKIVVHDYWLAYLCITFGEIYFDNKYHTYYRQHGTNAIGYGHGPRGWIIERLKRIKKQAAKDITRQNQLFYNTFKEEIAEEQRKELKLFLNSQRNIWTRSSYLLKANVYRQKKFETFLFYVLYFFGGYKIDSLTDDEKQISDMSDMDEVQCDYRDMITVVLATYNGEAYIKEQLDSILHQTREIHELIIYDDASTDATLNIVKEYQQKYAVLIKVFSQPHRVGYIHNFASALKEAEGTLIFLCDQDDIWELNKVECIVRVFERSDDVLAVASSFGYVDKDGKEIPKKNGGNNYGMCWNIYPKDTMKEIKLEEILFHNISMGCTMAFSSEIIEEYLETSSFEVPHDWELFFITSMYEGTYFLNKELIRYRIHDKNTTGNDKMNRSNHVFAREREKNAQALCDFAHCLQNYNKELKREVTKEQLALIEDVRSFHELRLGLLKDKKLGNWFTLLRRYEIYEKVVSGKGMLTDLLYALRK